MLCHRFGLAIVVKEGGCEIALSGFFLAPAYQALLQSVKSTHQWQNKAPKNWTNEDTLEIFEIFAQANELLDYSQETFEKKVERTLQAIENKKITVLPTEFEVKELGLLDEAAHAAVAIIFENTYIKGDRALFEEPGLHIYDSNASKDKQKEVVLQLAPRTVKQKSEEFFYKTMNKILDLKHVISIEHPLQHANTCGWSSSAKLAFQGVLFAYLRKKGMTDEEAYVYSYRMYHSWAQEDREMAMQEYLDTVPESEVKTQVLACIYHHLLDKKMRKNYLQDPMMQLIEKRAPEAAKLSAKVEISKDGSRTARIKN